MVKRIRNQGQKTEFGTDKEDPNLPTANHKTRAARIDAWVQGINAKGGGREAMLRGMADYMSTFKGILATANPAQMDALSAEFPGFQQFARLLEDLARGIRDGRIEVPKE
jgi:hypothetical protein